MYNRCIFSRPSLSSNSSPPLLALGLPHLQVGLVLLGLLPLQQLLSAQRCDEEDGESAENQPDHQDPPLPGHGDQDQSGDERHSVQDVDEEREDLPVEV